MAFLNDTGGTPYQLNQNSGSGLGRGQSIVQSMGVNVTGGSTVAPGASAPGFQAPPGSPTSTVYMGAQFKGAKPPAGSGPYAPGYRAPYTGGGGMSYAEASMLPTTWSEKELRSFVNKGILYKAQGFSADMGMPEIVNAWQGLVQNAQQFSQSGTDWSPYDVLETYNQKPGSFGTTKSADGDWLLDARTGERIKYIGPRSKTTTSKHVDLSSPEDVRALATQSLTELLGRAPTAEEMTKYRASIAGYEKSNPQLTTTTTQINDQGEATGESSTTSGGATDAARAGLISDEAKQGPEYGKFQSATTYFNAMMQMMGG